MSIIGQDNILEKLNNIPRVLLLVGDRGSGKHLIISKISDILNLSAIDISSSINKDQLYEIFVSPEQYIYILDFSKISIKNQNVLLKFIEEPPLNCYVIGICENINQVIYTLQNRFKIWNLEKYSKEELKIFTENSSLLEIFNTPGQIIEFNTLDTDIDKYKNLCDLIIEKISNANIANILTIPDKISFTEKDKSGISIDLFKIILLNSILEKIKLNNNIKYIKQYSIINEFINDLYIPNINKRVLFEHFLLQLKYTV